MQPPQPPYGGPPHPGPYAPPPYGAPPGPFPPGPPPRRSRAPLILIVAAAVVLFVGGVGAFALLRSSGAKGRFGGSPAACSLLTRSQVQAYLPGAASAGDDDRYLCDWGNQRKATGRLMVSVEIVNGQNVHGSPENAHHQYAIRRQQADEPGVTITPQRIGDEAFMACKPPDRLGGRTCEVYVRVSNVVFSVQFDSYPVPGRRDPASSASALTVAAVQNLQRQA